MDSLEVKVTTKEALAALKLKDMERIINYMECMDYEALDKIILSGRAFILPKGREVQVLVPRHKDLPVCKLRLIGSLAEIWTLVYALK
jgi:hypothetical protein